MATPQEDHESIARQIGSANLLDLRASTGLSQAQFAAVIGLSDRALRRYERGERELPQAMRVAIIKAFKIDPLASDQLALELGLGGAKLSPSATTRTGMQGDFWVELKREGQDFREQNYSPLGQLFLKTRDCAYLSATMYFAAKHIALAFDLPFGFEINGIDWVFLGAFLVIVLLFSSVVAELPLLKIVRHLLTSVKDGRAL
ncbi:helix-turn-helix domain-containing protein [Phaeobacter inhibens]|uniref:helix-turn-helix domain-containing protein n=1 Tax=Phaeobacter inhibens TaxID=221822 RepID=UPI002493A259|nr:helix-turn-helix transcriptional regulator [Phaeobacter inhibens]